MQKVEVGWTNKYGCIFRFWRGLNPFVQLSAAHHAEVTTRPHLNDLMSIINIENAFKAVLASTKHINKGVSLDALKLWLGEGLIVSPGNKSNNHSNQLIKLF